MTHIAIVYIIFRNVLPLLVYFDESWFSPGLLKV